jgi:hypothetical protein
MISLDTELTPDGIVCTHGTLGQVATIKHKTTETGDVEWYVFPYSFPPYERGAFFKSLHAAEFYAVALGYEMAELGRGR